MPQKAGVKTIRGIYRVNLYQTFKGELVLHVKGPDRLDSVMLPETLEEANDYIFDLQAQHPSQVKVTRWGDAAGGVSDDQLQKETLTSL